MGAKFRDRVAVSFWIGRAQRDRVLAIAAERKCTQAEVWRSLLEFALDLPVEQVFADREESA